MAQGDFELLSTYITIRTVGLDKVVAALTKVKTLANELQNVTVRLGGATGGGAGGGMRQASEQAERFKRQLQGAQLFMAQIQTAGRGVQQQLTSLALLETRIRTLQQQRNLTKGQQIQLERLLVSVLTRQKTLQGEITREAVRAQAAANAAVNAGAARLNQLATALGNMQREVRQLMNSISLELGFAAPFLRLGTNVFRVSQSFRQLARVAGLGAGAIRLAGIAGGVLTVGLAAMNTALRIAGRLMATVARIAGNLLKQAFSVLLGPTLALVRAFRLLVQNLPLVAAGFAALATRSLINIAQQFQRIEATFQFAFGASAQQELRFMTNLADRFGVPLLTISENYGRIASAARDAGLTQRELQTVFEGTSAAAVALGLDAERVGGLFFAFEQVISKGRLSAEELRRQIGDRLPGAFNIAARAMGVTTQRLDELLRAGAIDSVDFMRRFGQELVRTFGGAAVTASQRLVATLNRMRNAFLEIGRAIAVRLEPGFVRLINRIIDLTQRIARSAGFQRFVDFMVQQLEVLDQNFNRVVASIIATWERLRPALERVGRLMFVLNTVAIGTLVEGFTRLAEASSGVIGFLERFTERITGISLAGITPGIETFIKILQQIPLILEIVSLKFEAFTLRIQAWWQSRIPAGASFIISVVSQMARDIVRALTTVLDIVDRITFGWINLNVFSTDFGTEAGQKYLATLDEIERKQRQLSANLAAPLTSPFQRAQDAVESLWDRYRRAGTTAIASVRDRITGLFNEFRQFQAATTAAGPGLAATTGSGASVTVAASREQAVLAERTIDAAMTARNTGDMLVKLTELKTELVNVGVQVTAAVASSVLKKPGGGLNKGF